MIYRSRPNRSYTDAEGEDYWPEGECEGRDVEVSDDECTGVLDASGQMLWRQKPRCGFVLKKS